MGSLRILVVDDHEVVRRGVKALIESHPDWRVCGETGDGREAVLKAKELQPDVVVLDVTMPGLNGLDATRQIRNVAPKTEVLVLTMHTSEDLAREVLSAGARGYILKSDAGRDLVNAVESVARHKPFLTSRIAELVLDSFLQSAPKDGRPAAVRELTDREREVVLLLADGKTNKEVAGRLNISKKTAETHRANIMRKLRLDSLSGLVRYAIRNHLAEP
ncbi:MAG TPA: response regulator transcription factor [Candidatus Dormibacteraeota bacterium]|nr:response regulator transcription factor [Candidatus Dormibacteraeota bacterium]